jgi:hypothetical protein
VCDSCRLASSLALQSGLPADSHGDYNDNPNLSHRPCWSMYDATTIVMPRAAFEQAGVATVIA